MTKNVFSAFLNRASLPLLILALVTSGCRTYGGYGSEEASYEQIQESTEVFAREYDRAESDLPALKNLAASDEDMAPYVERYEALLAMHQEIIDRHAELAASLTVKTGFIGQLTPSYRNLNRALGSIASEQEGMREKYYVFAEQLSGEASDQNPSLEAKVEMSRYQAVPPFYQEIRNQIERRTVSEAVSSERTPSVD